MRIQLLSIYALLWLFLRGSDSCYEKICPESAVDPVKKTDIRGKKILPERIR